MEIRKLFLILLFISSVIYAQNKVYICDIAGEIDLGLAPYVKRVISEAEDNRADAIIFKINTFGGRVDAATQIKDAILNSNVKTIAFIDKRAISAGSLIALSCNQIVMVPGASMGATTVVDETGKKQSEKAQSYMRSEMRATAEKNGRRTDVAEGMVDERIVVEGLDDSTTLITLTSEEALKWGMADHILNSLGEVLNQYELKNIDLVRINENWAEVVVRFLNNPVVSSLLIMIGLVGLFTEIKAPGWGLPGTLGVIALVLFFGSGYLLELASVIEIILFVGGVILLLIEIFFIPGFGVFGIAGILLMIAGLFLGLVSDFEMTDFSFVAGAVIQLAVTFVGTGLVVFILSKFLPKTDMWNRLILHDNLTSTSGYTAGNDVKIVIGKEGTAFTDLRPAGTALIDGKRIDVVTQGDYVKVGTQIKVISEDGSKVVVERI